MLETPKRRNLLKEHVWNLSFTLHLYVNSWDLNFYFIFSRSSHSFVAFPPPQPGTLQWTSPPLRSAGTTIAVMATAKYNSRIPASPQFWHFYSCSPSCSLWTSSPEWNAGSTTTESSAPKHNALWFKSRWFRSHLHARYPGISFPTWNARSKSSWSATANYDVRWSLFHWSWRINPYPLDR